jgi:hypothetical protein
MTAPELVVILAKIELDVLILMEMVGPTQTKIGLKQMGLMHFQMR